MPNVPVYGQPLHLGQPSASEHDRLMERSLVSPENETYPRLKVESTVGEEPVESDEIKSEAEVPGTWQPKWLRAIVLGSFAALFVIFALGLPVILQHSQRHSGIVAAQQSFGYIWRFGPTAILTVIAGLWARVELQAMRYMPWIALYRSGLSMDKDIATLDYTSMLLPTVLVKSLRRKHYMLSLVIVTSVVLVAQIALAPGLFSLAAVQVEHDISIQTLDSFDTETDYANETTLRTETSAFYTVTAIRDFDMAHPFGVNDVVAYQTFGSSGGKAESSRGTVREPLRAVVDGLFAGVQCFKLKSHSVLETKEYFHPGPVYAIDVNLHFDECDKPIHMENTWITPSNKKRGHWMVQNRLAPEVACSGLPRKNKQFVYYAALFGPSPTNSSLPAVHKAAALVCTPAAWLSKVEVTDDGVTPNVTLLPNQKKKPIAANPWEILRNTNPNIFEVDGNSGMGTVSGPVGADWLREPGTDSNDPSLYENDVLLNSTENMLQTMIPYIGHFVLRQKRTGEAMGTRISTVDRLIVNRWICLSMAALFAITAVAVFIIIVGYGRSRSTSTWRRDPANIFGSMLFFHEHAELLNQLKGLTSKKSAMDWSQCNYSPLVLRSYYRLLSTTLMMGAIAGLITTLRMSNLSDGIASIDEEGYTHLLWTSVPALVMLSISLYMGSCNTAYRSLSTFPTLSVRPCSSREIDSSLLDMTGIRAVYRSIRLGCHTVTMSQLLALACGLLTTFSSILFTGKHTLPHQESALFPQETWFGTLPVKVASPLNTRRSLSSLLMRQGENKLNYPRDTYYDLVFPALGGMKELTLLRTLSVNVTTPAAQLNSTCRKLSEGDDYRVQFGGRKGRIQSPYHDVEVFQPYTCPNGTQIEISNKPHVSTQTNSQGKVHIGRSLQSVQDLATVNAPCRLGLNTTELRYAPQRHETYLWGEYSNGTKFSKSMSIYACTYEWTEVITKVHLVPVEGALIIDPRNPPQPDHSTRRPWPFPFQVPPLESAFPQIILQERWASLDDSFGTLIQPYGEFSMEDLGNPEKEEEVLTAMRRNIGFISAQLANFENRLAVNASSRTGPPPAEGFPPVKGTIITEGDYRLGQDAMATYVLVGILGAVVAFNLWALLSAALRRCGLSESRLLVMDVRGLAPDGFNSFAALGSLMRGSNASSHLLPGAELLSTEELHRMHSHLGFRLGWFREEAGQTKHFTIGVLGHDDFKFLGRKKPVQ